MAIFPSQILPDLDIDDDGRTGVAPTPSFLELIGYEALIMIFGGIVFKHRTLTIVGVVFALYNALVKSRPAQVLDDPFGEIEIHYKPSNV